MGFRNSGKMNVASSDLSIEMPNGEYQYNGSNEFIVSKNNENTAVEQIKSLGPWCKEKMKNIFRKKTLYKRVPITNWLPKYNSDDFIGDLVAGFTVGLTVIPQALAYAGIAGLPPAYGLYGSFLGCFIYVLLGSCKDVPNGPTAIASLLTFQTARGSWQRAVLLTFLTGLIELLMGIFGLGFLIDFVSGPVSSGFTSAVSLIILTSQVKDIFGIKASGSTFVESWISIFNNIHNTQIGDTIMGISCIVVLLLMRLMTNIKIGPNNDNEKNICHKIVNKTLWLIGTARNAVLVVVCGIIGYYFFNLSDGDESKQYLKLIGYIPEGLPNFELPPFSIPAAINDTTSEIVQKEETFIEMIQVMGSGLIVIPLIALLEDIAICKAFSNGKAVDATQELIAIGTANVFNSFVQGFPGTGSLSRSAVNNASGARTPLNNLYTGCLVILALLFFTPYFSYIPKSSLAGIIIAAVIFMIEVKVVRLMWRSKKTDLIPGLATFIACLSLPLELGVLVGIGINVVFILYHAARPKLAVEFLSTADNTKYMMLTPDRCLIFPSVDFVRKVINKNAIKSTLPVVIDCTHIYGADYTAAKAISTLIDDFKIRNQNIFFYNLKPSVAQVFEGASLDMMVFYNHTSLEMAISRNKEPTRD